MSILYQSAVPPGPCLTIPGLGGSRHHDEGAQAGTESVMNTDSSQLVTVVAVGQAETAQ